MNGIEYGKTFHLDNAKCCGNCNSFAKDNKVQALQFTPLRGCRMVKPRDVLLGSCEEAKKAGVPEEEAKTFSEKVCDSFTPIPDERYYGG